MAASATTTTTEQRTPEREALAVAIAARDWARTRLEEIRTAQERATDAGIAARHALDTATAELQDARATEAHRLAAAFIAGTDVIDRPADDAHRAAEERLATLRRARDALVVEADAADRELADAERGVARAVRNVALADPAVATALDECAVRFEAFALSARTIAFLRSAGVLPRTLGDQRELEVDRPDLAARCRFPDAAESIIQFSSSMAPAAWAAALDKLSSDADTPLPDGAE